MNLYKLSIKHCLEFIKNIKDTLLEKKEEKRRVRRDTFYLIETFEQ